MTEQLALDGVAGATAGPPADGSGLTATQREILRVVRVEGFIRPVTAGRLVHAARMFGGANPCRTDRPQDEGCCQYASTDGVEALKRLVRRGLLVRAERGRYEIAGDAA